jgi:chromosome partitioning protein
MCFWCQPVLHSLEFESTGRFFDMLHSTFASIEEGENIAARALGRPELAFEMGC